jgi:microcystin-dependent protein
MATPFLSEIRMFTFGFAPKGWAQCNGQLLPINQNQALFALLGTTYGGNGQTTFALPNLQGQVPFHMGNGHVLGERGGELSHTLTIQEMATHIHVNMVGSTALGNKGTPGGNVWAAAGANPYGTAPDSAMNPASISSTGGSQAHTNMQPYLVLNFCIALQGIFPSQN